MTTIPDAAIEAAAEAAWRYENPKAVLTWAELDTFTRSIWRGRMTAAMPAIREHIAQEIEAERDEIPSRVNPAWHTLNHAARIVREGIES